MDIDSLVGLVVKASASRAVDLGSNPAVAVVYLKSLVCLEQGVVPV